MMSVESIQHLRREVGMSQSELAIEVGVSQSYIARIENGSLDPKLSVVNKIFKVLASRQSKHCSDIMTKDPKTVDARDPASVAVKAMRRRKFSQMPVLRGTQIVGIITERDILRNLQHDMSELSVQAVMSPEGVPMVDGTTPVNFIIPLLQKYQANLLKLT
jgi:predicted transcriptional regulator